MCVCIVWKQDLHNYLASQSPLSAIISDTRGCRCRTTIAWRADNTVRAIVGNQLGLPSGVEESPRGDATYKPDCAACISMTAREFAIFRHLIEENRVYHQFLLHFMSISWTEVLFFVGPTKGLLLLQVYTVKLYNYVRTFYIPKDCLNMVLLFFQSVMKCCCIGRRYKSKICLINIAIDPLKSP